MHAWNHLSPWIDVHTCAWLSFDLTIWSKSPQLPFYERWKLLEKEVIEPRNMEREGLSKSINPYYRYDLEPFSVRIVIILLFYFSETFSSGIGYLFIFLYFLFQVRRKGFWLLSTVSKLLHKFIPQLSHSSDGLVFQVIISISRGSNLPS